MDYDFSYGFLSFAKNIGKITSKKLSEDLKVARSYGNNYAIMQTFYHRVKKN